MDVTGDELAGVIDLFGGLTRAELERALSEAAFRADGGNVDEDALADAIDEAVDAFALVRHEVPTADASSAAAEDGTLVTDDAEPLLVAGPTAFPRVPEGAEDVPHILDVERRRLDREALGEAVRDRFVAAVADALGEDRAGENETRGGDEDETRGGDVDLDRVHHLLEVSYDVEAWAPVDVGSERARLEAALEEG